MTTKRTPFLMLAAAAVTATAAACSSTSPAPATSPAATTSPSASASAGTASLPDTPAGTQARWLFSALARPPVTTAQIDAHFDQTALGHVTPAQLEQVFAAVKSLKLDAVTASARNALVMTVTENGTNNLTVSLETDSAGLIDGLLLRPASTPATPTSWAGVKQQVESVAPQTEMLVAQVSQGSCQPVQAIDATTPAPLGSAFKLYVLDAVARAVAAGQVSWNQQVTVTSQLKSLPSGSLQNDQDGTKVTIAQAADGMISQSDNTATNLLLALVGRAAVEQAAVKTGMAKPSLDEPFLTTRELFVLKLVDWPALANRYLAASPAGRPALLTSTVDTVPYSTLTAADAAAWTTPRDIGSLEWFASPADICRVYASLVSLARQPGLAPVGHALSINDGGLALPASQWKSVWFKGGSEPGVLTLNFLATTTSGRIYLVSVLTANPQTAFAQTPATLTLLSAAKGALELAAAS